jgi:hypothetical protein
MLKFVIYRPHENIWFRNPIRNILNRQLLPNKYGSLLDYLINSDNEIYLTTKLCIDDGLKNYIKAALEPLEIFLWCLLNRISIFRVRFIFTKRGLAGKDVLMLMHYGTFTHEDAEIAKRGLRLAKFLSNMNIHKIVHMTHYAYNPLIGAKNLEILNPDLLVAENNLASNSKYYEKYFGKLAANFYQLPYVPAARFIRGTSFEGRINKMVVSGSITFKMTDVDFINFFQINELQPLRRIIYENSHKYTDKIYSLISDVAASYAAAHSQVQGGFIVERLRNLLLFKHPQMSYYKQDIVVAYNSHKMFSVPEEVCNLPAIGFVEGMACGCAFFGLDDPMYRDIGMIPGEHYVAYDGSLEGLMEAVSYYQINSEKLENIAENGHSFVIEKLNANKIYSDLIAHINLMINAKNN